MIWSVLPTPVIRESYIVSSVVRPIGTVPPSHIARHSPRRKCSRTSLPCHRCCPEDPMYWSCLQSSSSQQSHPSLASQEARSYASLDPASAKSTRSYPPYRGGTRTMDHQGSYRNPNEDLANTTARMRRTLFVTYTARITAYSIMTGHMHAPIILFRDA